MDDGVLDEAEEDWRSFGVAVETAEAEEPSSGKAVLDGSATTKVTEVLIQPNPTADQLYHLGDGVGALTYEQAPSKSMVINHDMRRRIEVQDFATVAILLVALAFTIVVNASVVYQVSDDPSPVAFYSDPKMTQSALHPRLLCGSANAESFLSAFNTQPQCARLRVVGRQARPEATTEPSPCWSVLDSWCGGRHPRRRSVRHGGGPSRRPRAPDDSDDPRNVFDIVLDLTPFITGGGRLASRTDEEKLEEHMRSANPLEVLMLSKDIEWPGWEDIAVNVKQRLRALGFTGELEVSLEAKEEVLVYRNCAWQNFVRSRLTQALMVMSVVGLLWWVPYLWWRMRTVRVESRFLIRVDHARYWEHLEDGLNAAVGFRTAPLSI